jgi:DNA polymerase-3 subunit epsilon/CBS domain-containing protein
VTVQDLFRRYLKRRPQPARVRVAAHTPLERLSLIAIDCETTGLDARRDRIVSFAAIRIAPGLEIVDAPLIDILVDPGVAIPPRASAVHGLDRLSVTGAPHLAEVFAGIADTLHGNVVVGHHVGFDLTLLASEAARIGRPWPEPPSLDTARLAPLLGLSAERHDLADMLMRLGAEPRTRHTAAGDARMAADLFVAIARRLIGQGQGTFAAALAAQRS